MCEISRYDRSLGNIKPAPKTIKEWYHTPQKWSFYHFAKIQKEVHTDA